MFCIFAIGLDKGHELMAGREHGRAPDAPPRGGIGEAEQRDSHQRSWLPPLSAVEGFPVSFAGDGISARIVVDPDGAGS